jgi:hypothetical protein
MFPSHSFVLKLTLEILMVGGFGSLGGDIDFWDMTKPDIVKMGHAKAFSSTHHSWNPDGYYLIACCLKYAVEEFRCYLTY